jgi:hypothetical protein
MGWRGTEPVRTRLHPLLRWGATVSGVLITLVAALAVRDLRLASFYALVTVVATWWIHRMAVEVTTDGRLMVRGAMLRRPRAELDNLKRVRISPGPWRIVHLRVWDRRGGFVRVEGQWWTDPWPVITAVSHKITPDVAVNERTRDVVADILGMDPSQVGRIETRR